MIKFKLTGDSTELQKAAKDGQQSLVSLRDTADATAKRIGMIAGAATAAAAVGLVALVNRSREAIEAQADLAKSLDTTYASLSVLERAGDMAGVSMDTITASAKKLKINLSEAAANGGPAADALKRLHLNGADLAALPLDQRIAAINQAIKEQIPAMEQAAVAGDLFGKKAGSALLMLDPDTMAEATRQAQLFGTALSDIDAAKVDMANDAFGTFSMAADGIVKQFTVQVAPVLKAIGDLFLESAGEAGGFGKVAENVFNKLVDGAAFVMNAFDGIKRVVSLVLDGIMKMVSEGAVLIDKFALGVAETLDKIPGIDMGDTIAFMKRDLAEAEAFSAMASQRIADAIEKPLAGDRFKKFVEDAKVAAQEAATVEVAKAAAPSESPEGTGVNAADAAKLEAQKKALQDRIDAIATANMTEVQLAQEKFIAENDAIKEGLAQQLITVEEANALSLGAAQRFSDAKLAVDQQRADAELKIEQEKEATKKRINEGALAAATTLMNNGNRKLFEIGKAASIAQALIATYKGASEALALGPAGIPAAAAITVAGLANVDNIRKQQFSGGSAGAGTGAGTSATQAVNAAATPTQAATSESRLFIQGLNPNDLFSGSAVRNLAEKLVEFSRGGGKTSVQFA